MDHSGLPTSEVPQLKALLAPLLTCPLCNRIFKDAVTINECLHTFCRECILHKFHKDRNPICPTCNADLSHLAPEHYLRPDDAWRTVVNGYLDIFPK